MDFLQKLFGTSGTVQQDLRVVKNKFADLHKKHKRQATIVGFGSNKPIEIINIICGVCDDAIKALDKGLDVDNLPINRRQISDGIKRLVRDARHDSGVVAIALDSDGVNQYGQYLDELEQIANRIH